MSEKKAKAEKATEEKKAVDPKIQQNDVTRPKAGTKTGRVWEIADQKSAANKSPAKRKEVLDAAELEGINAATAATQYGRWRKFHGLKGTDEVGSDAGSDTKVEANTESA